MTVPSLRSRKTFPHRHHEERETRRNDLAFIDLYVLDSYVGFSTLL